MNLMAFHGELQPGVVLHNLAEYETCGGERPVLNRKREVIQVGKQRCSRVRYS